MTPRPDWSGVFPAAVTHFRGDEALDLDATAEHLRAMRGAGVHGFVMLGTVGENGSLSADEKLAVLRAAVDAVGAAADGTRLPVLVGVAETTTAGACRFAAAAADAGADGLMVLPAMIYRSDARECVHHFRAVAAAAGLPVMIYNNPVSYGVDLRAETFAELADDDRFVAIKESSEDPRRLTDIVNRCGDRYQLLCGVDDLVVESFAVGATGWVSGLVNAFPAENRLLWDALTDGRWDDARRIYRWYTPLLHLDTLPKLVQYIKLAVSECGLGSELCRAPRLKVTGEERERVLRIIRDAIADRPSLS